MHCGVFGGIFDELEVCRLLPSPASTRRDNVPPLMGRIHPLTGDLQQGALPVAWASDDVDIYRTNVHSNVPAEKHLSFCDSTQAALSFPFPSTPFFNDSNGHLKRNAEANGTTEASSQNAHTSVIVVGAGPVGLLTALRLAEAGISVTMLEALPTIEKSPRAMAYQPVAVKELDRAGVLDAVRKIGGNGTKVCWTKTSNGEVIAQLETRTSI